MDEHELTAVAFSKTHSDPEAAGGIDGSGRFLDGEADTAGLDSLLLLGVSLALVVSDGHNLGAQVKVTEVAVGLVLLERKGKMYKKPVSAKQNQYLGMVKRRFSFSFWWYYRTGGLLIGSGGRPRFIFCSFIPLTQEGSRIGRSNPGNSNPVMTSSAGLLPRGVQTIDSGPTKPTLPHC